MDGLLPTSEFSSRVAPSTGPGRRRRLLGSSFRSTNSWVQGSCNGIKKRFRLNKRTTYSMSQRRKSKHGRGEIFGVDRFFQVFIEAGSQRLMPVFRTAEGCECHDRSGPG